MTDRMTPEQRHRCMAAIRSRDTRPEMVVRRYLWGRGFRYRLSHPWLPGHPDIVLRKYRTAIFVNGCFWHGHENCKAYRLPKTNTEFWQAKIERNRKRDAYERRQLAAMGWHCIVVWECELKPKARERTLHALEYTLGKIYLADHTPRPYTIAEEDAQIAAEPECDYGQD